MMRNWKATLFLFALFLLGRPESGHAEVFGCYPWKLDSTQVGVDRSKPQCPDVRLSGVWRGYDCYAEKGTWMEEAEVGCIQLSVHGEDDRTPSGDLGYRLRLAAGEHGIVEAVGV